MTVFLPLQMPRSELPVQVTEQLSVSCYCQGRIVATPRVVLLTCACLKMCMMKMVRPRPKM